MEMLRFSAAETAHVAAECAVRMRDNSRPVADAAQGVARLRLCVVK